MTLSEFKNTMYYSPNVDSPAGELSLVSLVFKSNDPEVPLIIDLCVDGDQFKWVVLWEEIENWYDFDDIDSAISDLYEYARREGFVQ